MAEAIPNLYVHFPFCRRKCTYCALYSKIGVSESARADYVAALARELTRRCDGRGAQAPFKTVYFGGGSPALCDLRPLFAVLAPYIAPETEFTVELHPSDVTAAKLDELKALGVNRLSMGIQSLDDRTLAAMGRGYTVREALAAFEKAKKRFDNAGIDLIVGYPGDLSWTDLTAWTARFRLFDVTHCSVYSLQNERNLKDVPSDDWILDRLREVSAELASVGLVRYEISNYAKPGFACRHNLATWRGEDYLGLGEGAYGRVGLTRTKNGRVTDVLTPQADALERKIFRLRTTEGLDAGDSPHWLPILDEFVREGLLIKAGTLYRLTPRGTEVCDSILAELL